MLVLQRHQDNRNRVVSLLVAIIFAIGVSYPTSSNGVISANIYQITPVILGIFFCILIPLVNKIKFSLAILFLIINSTLWLVTLLNQPTQLNFGSCILFTTLTLMFCINFKKIEVKRSIFVCFKIVNIVIIVIGWGMVLKNQWLVTTFTNHYSDFYSELVPRMLNLGKPVIIFGTHSVAAFYMFVFFFLNIKTYEALGEKKYFIYSISYLAFCYFMSSNTGILLLVFGVIYLIYKSKRKFLWLFLLTITISSLVYIGEFDFRMFFSIFDPEKSANGILGRYSAEGNLQNNINFILSNPFSAVGYSVSQNNFTFYDSGIISTTLRGTIFITILVYVSFYLFLRHNVINRTAGTVLFVAFFLFEIGFNNLFYFRTMFILPFIVLYLNYLETKLLDKQERLKHSNDAEVIA